MRSVGLVASFFFVVICPAALGHEVASGTPHVEKRALRYHPGASSTGVVQHTGSSPLANFGHSLIGMILGWVLLPFSFALLMVNEQNHARMSDLIMRAQGAAKSTDANEVDHALDWKVVHITGKSSTNDTLNDPEFVNSYPRCEVTNAAKLQRSAEMYLHVQKSETTGEGSNETTRYWVEQEWCSQYQDSSSFDSANQHNRNPEKPSYEFQETWIANVQLGARNLPKELVEKLGNWVNVCDFCYLQQQSSPQVGDIRVKWQQCLCGPTTVVALQDSGDSLLPYRIISRLCVFGDDTEKLRKAALLSAADYETTLDCPIPIICCCCNMASHLLHAGMRAEVFYIDPSEQTASEAFEAIKGSEACMANGCRVVGWLLMFISVMMIAHPMVALLRVIPFIGGFLASILQAGIIFLALIVTLMLSAIVVAIAYIMVRPVLTIALLAGVVGAVVVGGALAGPQTGEPGPVMTVAGTTLAPAVAAHIATSLPAIAAALTTMAPAAPTAAPAIAAALTTMAPAIAAALTTMAPAIPALKKLL